MLSSSAERVPAHTDPSVNRRIQAQAERRIAELSHRLDRIGLRLEQLDQEWDTERTLEANAALLAFTGTALAATVDRRWLALPALVTAFLFQHAVQGWCPPLPVIRRLGFRTPREIEQERHALKALRGDYDGVRQAPDRATAAIRAAAA
jgi:hypothetical protein